MDIKQQLVEAYNQDAKRRDEAVGKRAVWKEEVRQKFADMLKSGNKKSILELGAGGGFDSKFFQEAGFDVLATDLSPEMVKMCIKRGIPAQVADIYDLSSLDRKFDAVFSMNVLLHVPRNDLQIVLYNISNVLTQSGLFFYGVYGGQDKEATITDNNKMGLPRFFSFLSDPTIQDYAKKYFEIVDFQTFDLGSDRPNFHFQALTLKRN